MLFNNEFYNIMELKIYSWYFDHFTLDTDHFRWRLKAVEHFLRHTLKNAFNLKKLPTFVVLIKIEKLFLYRAHI